MTTIDWGHTGFLFVNVVEAFGVDNTGGTDAGPALATAFADLAASGQVPWLRSGTYEVTTAAPPAVGQPVWVQPGVTFTGANAASVANVALVYGEAPGTPAYNPAWYALTDIYWDPGNSTRHASDSNSGATALLPLLTFAEIIRRYGSRSPQLQGGQTTTLHVLSSQPAGVDQLALEPLLSGGGNFIIDGTAGRTLVATFALGAVISKNRATGTPLSAAGFVAGGLAVGQIVVNNVTGSHSIIQALVGGVATLGQPLAHATPVLSPGPAEDDTWTIGQSVSVYSNPALNIELLQGHTGDLDPSGANGFVWVAAIHIPDSSGIVGNSYGFQNLASSLTYYQDCTFDRFMYIRNGHISGKSLNCGFNGGGVIETFSACGGYFNLYGCVIGQYGCLDLDAIVTASANPSEPLSVAEECFIGYALVPSGTISVYPGSFLVIDGDQNGTAGAGLYGGAGLQVGAGAQVTNRSGGTWATRLYLTGTLEFDPAPTGARKVGGQWFDGIALTAANFDKYGGLEDPATGARFSLPQASSVFSLSGWLSQANIYWDPGNSTGLASDSNSGATALLPLLTFAEIVHRYGSRQPQLLGGQTTTLRVLSSQPAGSAISDPGGSFKPNASMGMFAMIGTPSNVGATFNATLITQIVRSSAGNDFHVSGVPGAAAAGQLIFNTTQSSYCVVQSVAAGIATCSQPCAAATLTTPANDPPLPTPDGASWLTTDTLQLQQNPTVFFDEYSPSAGTLAAFGGGGTEGASWTQNINFGDPSGAGKSGLRLAPTGLCTFSLCTSAAMVVFEGPGSTNSSPGDGGPIIDLHCCGFITPWLLQFGGSVACFACILGTPGCITEFGAGCYATMRGDTIIDASGSGFTVVGILNCYNVHIAGGSAFIVGQLIMQAPPVAGCVWGSTTLHPRNGKMYNRSGSTYALQALVAGFQLAVANLTTGSAYNVSAGVGTWAAGIALNAANIDTGGTGGAGLQDVPSGAGFS